MSLKVNLTGFFRDCTGYGEAARRTFRALEAAGADVRPGVCLSDGSDPMTGPLEAFLASESHEFPAVHLVVAAADQFVSTGLHALPAAKRVGYSCWETDALHPAFEAGCAAMDLVILPSKQAEDTCRKAGLPTAVVPFCAGDLGTASFLDGYVLGQDLVEECSRELNIPNDLVVIYSILTWQERKNPMGLLVSYLTAFDGYDPVRLILKVFCGPAMRESIERQIRAVMLLLNLPNPPAIQLVTGAYSDRQLWALHARGDCYLSLSRGEAFGLPILDAFCMGSRIVAPDWGGHVDFLSDGPFWLPGVKAVPSRMTPVMQAYHYFNGHQNWADPDIIAARSALQEQVAVVRERPQKVTRDLLTYAPAAVGQHLLEVLSGH